jgi:hypothetical protein
MSGMPPQAVEKEPVATVAAPGAERAADGDLEPA